MSRNDDNSRFNRSYYKFYRGSDNTLREFARRKLRLTPIPRPLKHALAVLSPDARILDVGAGTGGLLEALELRRADTQTFAVDPGSIPEFRSNAFRIFASGEQMPFAGSSFDLVTCSHVIEHISEPYALVREILRVTRPNGWIYIETPSHRHAMMPFGTSFWDDPTHIRPYSPFALKRMLQTFDLKDVRAATKKSLSGVVLGLPYMALGRLLGDPQASLIFTTYAFGLFSYAVGRKG